METFAWPTAGLNPDESINGHYGPSVQPASVAAAGTDTGGAMSLPVTPQWSAVLIWWFILLGAAVAMHVLFLRINQ